MANLTATPNPVEAGGTITITYCNEDMNGGTVEISIGSGGGNPQLHTMDIDSNGKGTLQFTVPAGWTTVLINAPDAQEVQVTVEL